MMTFVERMQSIGEQKGVILGVKQGVEIGVKQGVVKEQNRLFLHMLRQGFSAESIAQMTGGSLAQILKVQESMDKEGF